MEKTGADIRVQKSEEMAVKSNEREIQIYGGQADRERARELVLGEVAWARDADTVVKAPPPPTETPGQGDEQWPRAIKDEEGSADGKGSGWENWRPSRNRWWRDEKKRKSPKRQPSPDGPMPPGLWVCTTCGGDHRTKECPHVNGLLGAGMQIGMQMGMQAMGMQGLQMGMQMAIAPPMMPMMAMPGMLGPMDSDSDDSSADSSEEGRSRSRASSGARSVRKASPPARAPPKRSSSHRAAPALKSGRKRRKKTGAPAKDLEKPRRRRRRKVLDPPPEEERPKRRRRRKREDIDITDL